MVNFVMTGPEETVQISSVRTALICEQLVSFPELTNQPIFYIPTMTGRGLQISVINLSKTIIPKLHNKCIKN